MISPILANLFLHYTFDPRMARTHADLRRCRHADEGLVHCRTEREAEDMTAELQSEVEGVRTSDAPDKDADRLLQGQHASANVSEG